MGAIVPKSSVRGFGQFVAAPLNSSGGGQPVPWSAGVPTRVAYDTATPGCVRTGRSAGATFRG